jgi:hypothetical protein
MRVRERLSRPPSRWIPIRRGCELSLLLASALLSPASAGPSGWVATEPPSYAFLNGNWFDGEVFRRMTVYSAEGRLTFRKPERIARAFDLKGGYVIPPFGEAHNHNLTGSDQEDEMLPAYLKAGVFYAKMQSSLPQLSGPIRSGSSDWERSMFACSTLFRSRIALGVTSTSSSSAMNSIACSSCSSLWLRLHCETVVDWDHHHRERRAAIVAHLREGCSERVAAERRVLVVGREHHHVGMPMADP